MNRIAITCTMALLLLACSSKTVAGEGDDTQTPAGMAAFEELEQCSTQQPCGLVSPFDSNQLSCALTTLRAGEPARIRVQASVTGDERLWWDLFVTASGDVQVIYRDVYNDPDSNWDDPLDYGWRDLQQCKVAATQVDGCLTGVAEGTADPSCQDVDSWYESCAAAEPQCP